jgi:glycosyltransferase involved in cell wall biosynthesis
MQETITPLILTYNEAANLPRTLERLRWARRILIVDSFSADETLQIAAGFPQVTVVQRRFDEHATQWNFGLDLCQTDWVLALDADHVLSEDIVAELHAWEPAPDVTAYVSRFVYCVQGRPLRGSLYPPRAVLFRRSRCHFYQDGHTQALRVEGRIGWLRNIILHDDRKPLAQWIAAQDRYAALEIDKLTKSRIEDLTIQDRIRRCVFFAPAVVFFYTLFVKRLLFDGRDGWYYTFQRTLVELLISLRLSESRRVSSTAGKELVCHDTRSSSPPTVQR